MALELPVGGFEGEEYGGVGCEGVVVDVSGGAEVVEYGE